MLRALIIDNNTKHLEEIVSLLSEFDIKKEVTDYKTYRYGKNDFDLYILSGGNDHLAVNSRIYYPEELKLVKNTTKPVIGICLGFQIICFAFNTKLEKLDRPLEKITITTIEASDHNIFGNLLPLKANERHKWGVKELSDELLGLAKSKYGWEIVKHKEKPIYGIQFHPEIITEDTKGYLLFYKIIKDISK